MEKTDIGQRLDRIGELMEALGPGQTDDLMSEAVKG
jgi:ribosome assembly protein YihI (activator of Der GTPase)